MLIYFFDPSYTSVEILENLVKVLKVRKIYSLMRQSDLTDEMLIYHKSEKIDLWSESTSDRYDVAFKDVAKKVFPIVSYPWYNEGKLMGYMSKAHAIPHRPILSLAKSEDPSPNYCVTCNILILQKRGYQFGAAAEVCPMQTPQGGIFRYVKKCLEKQDVSSISPDSPLEKRKSTVGFLDSTIWITIRPAFEYISKTTESIINGEYFHFDKGVETSMKYKPVNGQIPRELLILDELSLANYAIKAKDQEKSKINSLGTYYFHQYILQLLCDRCKMTVSEVVQNFMTKEGRTRYEEEENKMMLIEKGYEDDYKARQQDSYSDSSYKDELNYIRRNGGDCIDD
ncbi:MAG: hypothetical protein NC453_11350 [Muribaculum sp.]|nr:hypothetical protein [Muribaculum sp.]